jgi:gluconate 2-dehydrogenase alpha chain
VATLPKVDVVFVGFGMVGGIIASELSKRATNLQMVGLERGPFRNTNPDFLMDHFDEFRYAVQGQMFQDVAHETWTFRNDPQGSALPVRELGAFLPGNGVGGGAVHWNGMAWRFLDYFFEYRTHLERRYGQGFLPDNSTIQDWGITYAELEPYYTQWDKTFGIAGKAGNIQGVIQPGGNPFEGPRSEEYPQPPNKIAYGPTLFKQAADQLGFKTYPYPTANSPGVYTNPDGQVLAPCNYCGFCERFGCHVGAKASPVTTVIPTALASGRVEIREYANVFRINTSGGRATSVSYFDATGEEQEQPADLVVLGAFTLSNTRLLLLSGIGQPYDPQANTGVVGRNFTYQVVAGSATGWYSDRIVNRFMGSGANGYCIDEFNSDNFDHSGLGFFGGGLISANNAGARPIQSFGPLPPGTPTWGSGFKAALKQHYNRSVSFGLQGESPAYRQNYMDLDPTYADDWGNPLLRITFNFTDNERMFVKYIADNALAPIVGQMNPAIQQVSGALGNFNIVPYQTTHVCGGTIMGDDPRTSVVNKFGQVWGMPNLFVIGASNFPQNAGLNPTGTVGALAYHAVDAMVTSYLPSPGMLA